MKRRLIACLLCAILAVSFAGCNKTGKTVASENEFTCWMWPHTYVMTRATSYNELEMYKKREADSGVHIEFIHPPAGMEQEQFNLMIASRELPDIIEWDWLNNYPGGPAKAIEDGIIIPLNEYLDYAPNFKAAIFTDSEDPEVKAAYERRRKSVMTDDGHYYGFPCFNKMNGYITSGMYLRKDWLDELNLPVPETIDDWTVTLRGFKEKMGATAPYVAGSSGFGAFSSAFGVTKGLYMDGDKIKFGPLEPGYKTYLQQIKAWYDEGLVDRDYLNNSSALKNSKMLTGVGGATSGYIGNGLGTTLKQMENDPKYNLVGAPAPVLKKGDVNKFGNVTPLSEGPTFAITTACKNPKAAVEWIDYWYSEEGYMLNTFGVEGISYNMVDGKPVMSDEITNNPEGLSFTEAFAMHSRNATGPAVGWQGSPEYTKQYYNLPQQWEAYQLWSKNGASAMNTEIPEIMPTVAESEELAALKTEIETYVNEMTVKFIQGIEPLDRYDEFIKTLKTKFNVDRYIEMHDAMYKRYLNR